tara:strand:+ start:149 stop:973 length:825 start_codon:yes stop_codon:yes gene_type:complete
MYAQGYDPGAIEDSFFKIWITHLATRQTIDFRGWVREFSDQFNSTWNTENVYGRMDPLATFQNTQRQISLAFDVVSGDATQAQQNLDRINSLISFLYPVYETEKRDIQNTLKAAPLLGLRWTNLIADPNDGSQLVGYLAGVSYAPEMDKGGFLQGGSYEQIGERDFAKDKILDAEGNEHLQSVQTTRTGGTGIYIPKTVSLSLQFTVLHKHLTGWSKSGTTYSFGTGTKKFPNASNVVIPGTSQDTTTVFDNELASDPEAGPLSSAKADIEGSF